MDLRRPVLAILVGGSPAPGINGVIAAATIEAINSGCDVIGLYEGYKRLKDGKSKVVTFTAKDVLKIAHTGGSIIRTSKMHPNTPQEVDNVLRVLEHLRVRYLVTIGGTITAHSSTRVAAAAKASKLKLSIVHVPKTIFNDIPLPGSAKTFGFATARQVGHGLVQMFAQDASTMVRWYILTCVGVQTGHLTLGIGKSAAANLTLIPEEFSGKKLKFSEIVDIVESTIYKRRAEESSFGVAMLCEGLADQLDPKEIKELFGGSVDDAHQDLGRVICVELQKRFKKAGLEITTVARNIGTECRAADPSAEDILLSRDLGYGAVRYLMEGGTGSMVSLRGSKIQPIPLTDLVDEKTGSTAVRTVNTNGIHYRVARQYMDRIKKSDFASRSTLSKLAAAANLKPEDFTARFSAVAIDSVSGSGGSGGSSGLFAKEDSVIADISRGGYVSPPTSNVNFKLSAAALATAVQHPVFSSPSPPPGATHSPASNSPVGASRSLASSAGGAAAATTTAAAAKK